MTFSSLQSRSMALVGAIGLSAAAFAWSQQPGGQPPMRQHTANEAAPLDPAPANRSAPGKSEVAIAVERSDRKITSNGLPDHKVGAFPNRGNPNEITEQGYDIVIPADPKPAPQTSAMRGPFGIALNGVFFDPGAAEFWQGNPAVGWTYEALGGAVPLGIDENHAHVQPNGAYHYHGLPTLYLKSRDITASRHSPQIGWAADGFPIYALYGNRDPKDTASPIVKLRSSYRLKSGARPPQPEAPGGTYDGAFVQDYEFAEGSGDLDECNGRFCVTPEFSKGTYAYFLTEAWPVIPRLFRGTPVPLPEERRGGPGPGFGPPPGGGKGGQRPPFPPR